MLNIISNVIFEDDLFFTEYWYTISPYKKFNIFLDPLWRLSPIPNMNDLFSKESISATAIAIAFVLFMMLRSSGVLRLKKLKDIEQEIDNQLIKESIKGELSKNKKEIEKNIKMPKQSFLSSFHSLYIAPLVIGIVLILLQKFLKI